jgi:hypothetical protein
MSKLSVLDKSGDTTVTWDPLNATEVKVAEQKFNQLVVHQGYAAYELPTEKGNPGVIIREFNPQAERILLTPRQAGG